MQKNVAGQKWEVFAFDVTTNLPVTGDAANITANIRIDHGSANAVADTTPTELEDGRYVFDLSQAETNGDHLSLFPESSTANVMVLAWPANLYTANNLSAADMRSGVDAALIFLNLDHWMKTPVVNNADMTVEVADGTALSNLMSSMSDTSTFTVATDSLEALAAGVNAEVVDALNVDTYAEPGQGAPPETASLVAKIGYLYKAWRNKTTQTATTSRLYNDAGTTVDQKATVSDDGTTATDGKVEAGP